MPIVKGNQALPPRPVIILLFGDPGSGKTSIANTCENPILIDADKGASRSALRKDSLQLDSWEEVLAEEQAGTFNEYKTICIDTPKALLDDFLKNYVINKDYKLKTNKLGMFGAIGDEFSLFVNNRRKHQSDLFIVCHAKKDEDTKQMIPDVTGGSYQLLMRIADQVGYVCVKNGQRVIVFEPNEFSVGKNVAKIPETVVPPLGTPAFEKFGASIIEQTRKAISSMSEEQAKALKISEEFLAKIRECDSPDVLTQLLAQINELDNHLKVPLQKAVADKAKEKGYVANKETKRFESAPAAQPQPTVPVPQAPTAAPASQPEPTPPQAAPGPQAESSEEAFQKMLDETPEPKVYEEEIPRGAAKFKKSYKFKETVDEVINAAKTAQELASLYFVNSELIEAHEDLKSKIITRKNQLNGQQAAIV